MRRCWHVEVSLQDEGKSKEGRSSAERGGEWKKCSASNDNLELVETHLSIPLLSFFYSCHFILPLSLSWSRRRLTSGVCRRSFRVWGRHWPRETPAFCSSRAPSQPWRRSSPPPTGKRSQIFKFSTSNTWTCLGWTPVCMCPRMLHQAEHEATLKEMRSLQERLNTSERASEGLKNDLSSMVAQRDHTQSELHQARLQAAQLTLQLADASLALREGRARWAQERQGLQLTAEVLYHWQHVPAVQPQCAGLYCCSLYHNRRTTCACRNSTLRSRRLRRVCRRRGWRESSWRLRLGEKRIVIGWEGLPSLLTILPSFIHTQECADYKLELLFHPTASVNYLKVCPVESAVRPDLHTEPLRLLSAAGAALWDPAGAAGAEDQFEGHPEREGAAAGRETGQTNWIFHSETLFILKRILFRVPKTFKTFKSFCRPLLF